MSKVKHFRHRVRLILMRIGMFAECCWDETKKFVWWLFAPNAYADLVHDYKALRKGYDELVHTWDLDVGYCNEEIDELKAEIDKLKEENEKLKKENKKLTLRLAEFVTRYEMAMDEDRPVQFPPHLLDFEL